MPQLHPGSPRSAPLCAVVSLGAVPSVSASLPGEGWLWSVELVGHARFHALFVASWMLICRLVLFRGERRGDRGALLAQVALGGRH